MSATKASPPSQRALPAADAVTILGYTIGWVMIVLGLALLGLSLTG